ncbi:hypothetical protein DYQ86_15740 [Acidobacteria bacterium AB60]|nr:hypothetical protein DYQ86_15740 [Acidobacteria bacterium AB60]
MQLSDHDYRLRETEELVLRPGVSPTPAYDDDLDYREYVDRMFVDLRAKRIPTEPDVLGPYFRKGAPFRAKVTPPNEPGVLMLVSGRVWGIDSRRPLEGTQIDIWQANARGHYDDDDPAHPPQPKSFTNRARLITDEHGHYEYETIHPGPYRMDADTWRSPHIHYKVRCSGYRTLVTQLFFAGDPYEDSDPFFKSALMIVLSETQINGVTVQLGIFDIVLAPHHEMV